MVRQEITCTRRLTFCAGHRVMGHENKCAHLHGHNYVIYITARGYDAGLDGIGRVIDFSVLKEKIGGWIDEFWDHGFILYTADEAAIFALDQFSRHSKGPVQKIFHLPDNPTAENLARYLIESVCPDLLGVTGVEVTEVTVEETENCSATVHRRFLVKEKYNG